MTTLPRLACVCVNPQANFGILARIRFLSWPMLGLLRYRLPLKFLSDITKLKKMSFCRNAAWLTESHCGIQTLFENSLPIRELSYLFFPWRTCCTTECISKELTMSMLLEKKDAISFAWCPCVALRGLCVCNPPAVMRASCGIQPTNIIYIYMYIYIYIEQGGNLMFAADCPTKRAAFMTGMTLGR